MIEHSLASQTLTVKIEQAVRKLIKLCLGYEPNSVSCQSLECRDLVISIERGYSATEKFLMMKGELDLALEIGTTINQVIKEKLALLLASEFKFLVASISFLEPVTPQKFGFFVMLENKRLAVLEEVEPRASNLRFLGSDSLGSDSLGLDKLL